MGCRMVSLIFLIIGILIILLSIIIIKVQSSDDSSTEEVNYNNSDDLVLTLDSLENIIDEINVTFNNTIDEIEKKYDMLETKIEQVNIKASEGRQINPSEEALIEINYENENNNNEIDDKDSLNQEPSIEKKCSIIKELRNKGMSIPEIARSLNIGIGEVMLIINLNKS